MRIDDLGLIGATQASPNPVRALASARRFFFARAMGCSDRHASISGSVPQAYTDHAGERPCRLSPKSDYANGSTHEGT